MRAGTVVAGVTRLWRHCWQVPKTFDLIFFYPLMKSLRESVRRLRAIVGIVPPLARAVHSVRVPARNWIAGRPIFPPLRDPHFKARFVDVPAILADWFGAAGAPIEGADILDFGCGEGVVALGLVMGFRPRRVVGVDIMPDPDRCLEVAAPHLNIEALPPSLALHRVEPGKLHDERDRFDLAYSWSVFEHVDQTIIDHSLSLIRSALRPGGMFLAQIAPLFYSPEGSHLNHVLKEPWVHLRMQQNRLEDSLRRAAPDSTQADALWSTYCTLNRITHHQLVERIRANGFEVLRLVTTTQQVDVPAHLLDVYKKEALLTNQVVVLARRTS